MRIAAKVTFPLLSYRVAPRRFFPDAVPCSAMPNVGLLTASDPLQEKNRVIIRYSIEVDGLAVYNESYDVDTVRQELATNGKEALKRWSWRLLGAAYCRDKKGFSACLTRSLVDGKGCACGHQECQETASVTTLRPAIEGGALDWMPKSVWGPIKWKELHSRALTSLPMDDEAKWFQQYVEGLPCPECREHFEQFLGENPPDFTNRGSFFEWTVRAHNFVNRACGKKELSADEARELHAMREPHGP